MNKILDLSLSLSFLNLKCNVEKKKASEEEKSLALVAAKCLCELLTTKTYFNFRLNIMVSVVACMSTVEWNEVCIERSKSSGIGNCC